jgi:hypothetical protein
LQKLFGPNAAGLVPQKKKLAYYCSRTAEKGDTISRGQTELLVHPELQHKLNIYFANSLPVALGPEAEQASLYHAEPALSQEDLEMPQFLDVFYDFNDATTFRPQKKQRI